LGPAGWRDGIPWKPCAGQERWPSLPYRRFLLYEGIAALAWNLVRVTAGYLVGEHLDALQRFVGGSGLALVGLVLVAYVVYRLVARVRSTRTPTT
jgi:membrane protein DedA with SNARE-associated domain